MRNHTHHEHVRVRVFIDYWNMARRWSAKTKEQPDVNFRWEIFPEVVMRHLRHMPYSACVNSELRGVKVYSAVKDDGSDGPLEKWLRNYMDQLPGYTVDFAVSEIIPILCPKGHESPYYVEKGVDTKIAIDLLALAMRDLYDIGVLISHDTDLVPSVECVQNVLDKHIVHLGFSDNESDPIRSAAWGHLRFEDMRDELQGKNDITTRNIGRFS